MDIQILQVMQDDDFQKIISEDEILNGLEKEKYNPHDQFLELINITSKKYIFGNKLCVNTITPYTWCLMQSLGNHYVTNEPIRDIDTDMFLYILSKKPTQITDNVVSDSVDFCAKNGLDYTDVKQDIQRIIYINFRPLQMLNSVGDNNDVVLYNTDWLTGLVSIVSKTTNQQTRYIMYQMALGECFAYAVQNLRQYDNNIRRKNSGQINQAIYLRTMQLGQEYYNKRYKGVK